MHFDRYPVHSLGQPVRFAVHKRCLLIPNIHPAESVVHPVAMFTEEYFMQQAFKQAEKAFDEGEVPVGAVVVCNDLIIAKAHNQTELLTDVTAHAEIIALTSAAEYLGSKYLNDCTMYVTLEPCVMCAGALAWAQLGRLVFGASDEKKGFFRYGKELLHPKTVVLQGVMEHQCGGLMTEFFRSRR